MKKSLISAHHNYLFGGILLPGFVLGDPASQQAFFIVADFLLPGESTPRISARLFDRQGVHLMELRWSRPAQESMAGRFRSIPGGFRVTGPEEKLILGVETIRFANGYLTRMEGAILDEKGRSIMGDGDPVGQILEKRIRILERPISLSLDVDDQA